MHTVSRFAYARQEDSWTFCICTGYAVRMVSRAKDTHTTNRVVRVDDDLWRDYSAACADDGVTKADDLRKHMQRKVRAWRRRQQAPRE